MEEEIVVDDINDNTDRKPNDSSTNVMPLLYIQQSKLRSNPSTTTNQTIVSSTATRLAAIIDPTNNQIVPGQNKVFIQGPNQSSTSQNNKSHIVIHRPINNITNNSNSSQGQKHVLLRKPNSTAAQIVPLSSSQGNQTDSQGGKHTFAYLGTFIKPNKSRESVVIPAAGSLAPLPQISKPKLVITPVLSHLPRTSTSTATPQAQPTKHMANLLLPVRIPQQGGSTKPGMFNLEINNAQINADNKTPTITVLRESKASNSTTHPPPLHPITKTSILNTNKNTNNASDSIKVTEYPDSAVITPILNNNKKDDVSNPPETKRKKTISNILRGSGEKRLKKQNLSKPSPENADTNHPVNSPECEPDKDKKTQNDDEITLIKVVQNDDASSKLKSNVEDDIKIENIKTSNGTGNNENSSSEKSDIKRDDINGHVNSISNQNDPNFDITKVLDWKDGVGTLPGSTLKFCMNEFGMMEMVEEDENNKQNKESRIGDKENVCLTQNSSKSNPATVNNEKKTEDRKAPQVSADTMYCCESCGCYGLAAEFESPISCSPSCTEIIASKKQQMMRKEKEAKDSRNKRKRKRLLQESLQAKETEEKEKVKSEVDEDTKESISGIEEESQNGESSESKYPWQTGKLGFSWAKYLEHCKAKAAPVKLFKDPFPYSKNHFRVGMKLEGIDPEHPSRYCVLTVVEVVGYRIRLHFDGYPESFDFWVNADSMDIFPVGWSEKNGHRLDPPKGYVASNFNWNGYLRICKATAAPKTIFSNKGSVFPTGFRVGMKLEAVDRKHSSLVCVASIAGLMDSRILVHFDSWDEVYDYWADASSPYIHPVGWCHHNGHSLTPPNNYKDAKSFTWDAYLRETRSMIAPARAFKQRPPCGFKRGMKLEVVDKRVPQLIRVATVEDVKDHMLKIRFDGWPENHAYWVDDDAPDIHPVGWCSKTGHPLEPPLTPENLNDRPECGTYGCRGIGHIKGPKFATHNSASGCPYSPQNLHKSKIAPDRLNIKHEAYDFEEDTPLEKLKSEKTDKIKMEKMDKHERTVMPDLIKSEKDIKQEEVDFTEKTDKNDSSERYRVINKTQSSALDNKKLSEKSDISFLSRYSKRSFNDALTDNEEHSKKRKRKFILRQDSEEQVLSTSNSCGDSMNPSAPYAANMPDKQLRMELYHSVYNPGYNPLPDAPHVWAKHSNALNRVVAKQNTNPRRWNNEEVIKFIQSVPNCKEIGSVFRKHNVDGEAFLMLTQEDLVTLLGLRLGPAIKLYNSIVLLRRRAS